MFWMDDRTREFRCEELNAGVPFTHGVPGAVLQLGGTVNVRTRKQIEGYVRELGEYEREPPAGAGQEQLGRVRK